MLLVETFERQNSLGHLNSNIPAPALVFVLPSHMFLLCYYILFCLVQLFHELPNPFVRATKPKAQSNVSGLRVQIFALVATQLSILPIP